MKKFAKKLMGAVLSVSLALGYSTIPVHADSMDGMEIGYSISTNSNSATAVTSYARPATIKAQARVSFTYGNLFLEEMSDINTISIGGVSATAKVSIPGSTVTGGRGDHWVDGSASWHKTTRTGNSKS